MHLFLIPVRCDGIHNIFHRAILIGAYEFLQRRPCIKISFQFFVGPFITDDKTGCSQFFKRKWNGPVFFVYIFSLFIPIITQCIIMMIFNYCID